MSDDKPRSADETQPVRPEGGATLPPAPAVGPAAPAAEDGTAAPQAAYVAEPAPAARRGFRERLSTLRRSGGDRGFGLAALIASALAGVIVGGLGVATFQAVTDDGPGDRGGWMQRGPMGDDRDGFGRDDDDRGDRGPMFGGPGGLPGEVQPTTPPDDDDSGSSS